MRLFGPRGDEVTGEWVKLHSEELNDLCCSRNIVWVKYPRTICWLWHVSLMKMYFVMKLFSQEPGSHISFLLFL